MKPTITLLLLFFTINARAQDNAQVHEYNRYARTCGAIAGLGMTLFFTNAVWERDNEYAFEAAKYVGPGLVVLAVLGSMQLRKDYNLPGKSISFAGSAKGLSVAINF